MTVGFNIGAINLGDCSLALDFLNNSEDYEPDITEVRQDILGKAPLVHDKPVAKPKITKTSLVHKYAIVNNQEEQDTILNESLVVADTAYEEDIEIDIEDNVEFGNAIEKVNTAIEYNRIGYEDDEEDTDEEEDAVDRALEDFDFGEDEEESDEEEEIQPVVAQPVISIQEEYEEETDEDETDEDSLLDDLFDEDEGQDEEEPEPVASVKATEVKITPPQIKVEAPREVSSVVQEVNIDTEEIVDETDEEIMLRKQLEEIQRRKREKAEAEADAIKIAKQKRVLELQKQLEREQKELESEEAVDIPISKSKQVVTQAQISNKQSVPVTRSASEIRHRQYDEMEIDALYIEVKRFLQQNGVEKGMVAASKVVDEFGSNCVQRLKKKSYIITIGKGVTIGR